jgi:DNA topoisomerase VI subunit B
MRHEDIPEMLGRVLSGTKFGVRQTRGKFGLGAKMALIWSKVSAAACQLTKQSVQHCIYS